MTFELPELGYEYNALEPHIDAQTMELHHSKHHAGYTKKFNAALDKYPELEGKSAEELISEISKVPVDIQDAVQNNGGGFLNHSWFWKMLSPNGGGEPTGALADAIKQDFNSFEDFKKDFTRAALGQFGSGWAWLVQDDEGTLHVTSTANQDNPIADDYHVLLGVDMWEHAFYKKYGPAKADYLEAIWNVINWDYVASRMK